MKKTIYFDGDINAESMGKFADKMVEAGKDSMPIRMIINSGGGEDSAATSIVEMINDYPHGFEIFVPWAVQSAAFDICCMAACKVTIAAGGWAGIHKFSRDVDTNDLDENGDQTKFLLQNLKMKNNWFRDRIKRFLTDQELKTYDKGKMVYLSAKRAQEIIDSNEIVRPRFFE